MGVRQEVLLQKWGFPDLGLGALQIQVDDYQQKQRKMTESDWRYRSYNIVFDRMHVDELRKAGSEVELTNYIKELRLNLETNLKERFHVVESGGKYIIRDGDIYSEFFSDEPMGRKFLRGATVRRMEGSPEWQREGIEGEIGGWMLIHQTFTDLDVQVGTQVISFSPPGEVTNSAYSGKFIDVFTLRKDNTGKYIEYKRLAVDYGKEQYQEKALALNPDFFDGFVDSQLPLDAWYLSHPVVTATDISELLEIGKGMSDSRFKQIFNDTLLQLFILQYIEIIYSEKINWRQAELAFNAIINRADELVGLLLARRNLQYISKETIDYYGVIPVREVTGGGCPTNKGYSIFETNSVSSVFSNSVLKFGVENTEHWEYHFGDCVVCKREGTEVGPCSICKECEAKF